MVADAGWGTRGKSQSFIPAEETTNFGCSETKRSERGSDTERRLLSRSLSQIQASTNLLIIYISHHFWKEKFQVPGGIKETEKKM